MWYFTVAIGNLLVIAISSSDFVPSDYGLQLLFFAALMLVCRCHSASRDHHNASRDRPMSQVIVTMRHVIITMCHVIVPMRHVIVTVRHVIVTDVMRDDVIMCEMCHILVTHIVSKMSY